VTSPDPEPAAASSTREGGGGARWRRRALKAVVLSLGVLVQLFPHPVRAVREIQALRDPQSQIVPDDPAIALLSALVDREMPPELDRASQVAWIEAFVERRIPYEHDWITWGNVDYWPTPSETLEAGREDCDGIAIVTASLLRKRGFVVRLEASYQHVWVEVEGLRILDAGETRWDGETLTAPTWRDVVAWVRYALSAFPKWRWALLVLWTGCVIVWPVRRRQAAVGPG